jgi:hypothetical protein
MGQVGQQMKRKGGVGLASSRFGDALSGCSFVSYSGLYYIIGFIFVQPHAPVKFAVVHNNFTTSWHEGGYLEMVYPKLLEVRKCGKVA